MRFATTAAVLAWAAAAPACLAANATNPYGNIDHRNDAGNDTGDTEVEGLNQAQLDASGAAAYASRFEAPAERWGAPPGYPANAYPPAAYPQPGYAWPGYAQASYPPPAYPPPGTMANAYPPPAYSPPGYAWPGYAQAPYPSAGYPPPGYAQ